MLALISFHPKENPLIRPKPNRRPDAGPQIRVNGRIRAREVRVIVAATEQQLGVLKLPDAMRYAKNMGLDLVEVAPNADPPVCRIVDFGKYRYELAKQEKDKKTTTSKLKELKFRVSIDDHDYMTKIRRGENFLFSGNKVRVQLQFRGRENAHVELGFDVMKRVIKDFETCAQVEMEPKKVGRGITMTLSPLPTARRRRKFTTDDEVFDDTDDQHEPDDNDTDDTGT